LRKLPVKSLMANSDDSTCVFWVTNRPAHIQAMREAMTQWGLTILGEVIWVKVPFFILPCPSVCLDQASSDWLIAQLQFSRSVQQVTPSSHSRTSDEDRMSEQS
jgi:hypothetical protein